MASAMKASAQQLRRISVKRQREIRKNGESGGSSAK